MQAESLSFPTFELFRPAGLLDDSSLLLWNPAAPNATLDQVVMATVGSLPDGTPRVLVASYPKPSDAIADDPLVYAARVSILSIPEADVSAVQVDADLDLLRRRRPPWYPISLTVDSQHVDAWARIYRTPSASATLTTTVVNNTAMSMLYRTSAQPALQVVTRDEWVSLTRRRG